MSCILSEEDQQKLNFVKLNVLALATTKTVIYNF